MLAVVLLLGVTSLVHVLAAAALWRQNQILQKQLLRVTAKATQPHAVVQEVAPSPHRTEDEDDRIKDVRSRTAAMWRR